MNSIAKRFRNNTLDAAIALSEHEIARWSAVVMSLDIAIEAQYSLIFELQRVILNLEDIINRLGSILGPDFIASIRRQITSAQDSIAQVELDIVESRNEQDKARDVVVLIQAFITELDGLKKKPGEDDGAFSVLIGNINGGETMEINLDKDGNAKVSKIADKGGNSLTRKPQWLADGDDIAELTPSEDGMSCAVKAKGPLGLGSLFVRVGKASDTDTEFVESNHLEIKATENSAAEVVIEEA